MWSEIQITQRMKTPWNMQVVSLKIQLPCTNIEAVNGITNEAVNTSAMAKPTKNMLVTVRSPEFLNTAAIMSRLPQNAVMITSTIKHDSNATVTLVLVCKSFRSLDKFSLSIFLPSNDGFS